MHMSPGGGITPSTTVGIQLDRDECTALGETMYCSAACRRRRSSSRSGGPEGPRFRDGLTDNDDRCFRPKRSMNNDKGWPTTAANQMRAA